MFSNISIKNYRTIREANVDLDPKLNVLVGPSGSGKSSFLSVLDTVATSSDLPDQTPPPEVTFHHAEGLRTTYPGGSDFQKMLSKSWLAMNSKDIAYEMEQNLGILEAELRTCLPGFGSLWYRPGAFLGTWGSSDNALPLPDSAESLMSIFHTISDPALKVAWFDNIDAGLPPSSFENLVKALRGLRVQVIATATNPLFIQELRPEELIVCEVAPDGSSLIDTVGTHALQAMQKESGLGLGELFSSLAFE